MIRSIAVLALVLCGASPVAAHADWQYTKWGMSPEQVIAASNGTARQSGNPETNPEGAKSSVYGTYSTLEDDFDVTFWFINSGLIDVYLHPKNLERCPDLLDELHKRYGPEAGARGAVILKVRTNLYFWPDPQSQNSITFGLVADAPFCWLNYGKLNSGL